MSIRSLAAAGWVLAILAPTSLAQILLDDSVGSGLLFQHTPSPQGFSMDGGVACFDMDADGDDDVLATNGFGQHALFRNDGGSFTNVSAGSGLQDPAFDSNFGVSTADFDGDGLPDVFLSQMGPNLLYRNAGGGQFEDVTVETGMGDADEPIPLSRMTTTSSWADFDLDGDLDLYVGNYIDQISFPYHQGSPNELWIQRDEGGVRRFANRGASLDVEGLGVYGPPPPGFEEGSKEGQATFGCTLSTCTLDLDEDGDPDLLVGNDFGMFVRPNVHYRNDVAPGAGLLFTDVSDASGLGSYPQYNMGINPCDVDRDGDWDLYLSDLGPNLLLRNDGGVFTDITDAAGPVEGHNAAGTLLLTSWATVFADLDNDGFEDLYVVNGYIPAASFIANEQRAPNGLWRNMGTGLGQFLRVPDLEAGTADQGVGRGAAATDVDGDGLLDLIVANNGTGLPSDIHRLFVNQGAPGAEGQHWLQVRLRAGSGENREAVGARLEAHVGRAVLKRQVLADGVYLSSKSRLVHFGLGEAEQLDRLVIHWPDGQVQTLHDLEVDRRLVVRKPKSELEVTLEALPEDP